MFYAAMSMLGVLTFAVALDATALAVALPAGFPHLFKVMVLTESDRLSKARRHEFASILDKHRIPPHWSRLPTSNWRHLNFVRSI